MLYFNAKDFDFNPQTQTYVAEASSLGLRPGQVPERFGLDGAGADGNLDARPLPGIVFCHVSTDWSGDDMAGWRYAGSGFKALIIND